MELSYSPKPALQTKHITDIADQKHILEPTIVQDFQCRTSFLLDRVECCNVTITWWVCRPKSSSEGSAFFPTPHSCTSSETPRISLSKVAVVDSGASGHSSSPSLHGGSSCHFTVTCTGCRQTLSSNRRPTAEPNCLTRCPISGLSGLSGPPPHPLPAWLPSRLMASRCDFLVWGTDVYPNSCWLCLGKLNENDGMMEQLFLSENVWRLLGSFTSRKESANSLAVSPTP